MSQVKHNALLSITRRDLKPGYQAVQAAHSAIEFQHDYPEISTQWNSQSKYLIFLTVKDELELKQMIDKFRYHNLKHSIFIEPDIDNQLTSVTVEPCEKSRKLTSSLPLMLKELK